MFSRERKPFSCKVNQPTNQIYVNGNDTLGTLAILIWTSWRQVYSLHSRRSFGFLFAQNRASQSESSKKSPLYRASQSESSKKVLPIPHYYNWRGIYSSHSPNTPQYSKNWAYERKLSVRPPAMQANKFIMKVSDIFYLIQYLKTEKHISVKKDGDGTYIINQSTNFQSINFIINNHQRDVTKVAKRMLFKTVAFAYGTCT